MSARIALPLVALLLLPPASIGIACRAASAGAEGESRADATPVTPVAAVVEAATPSADERVEQALVATRAGDYERAHALLGELIVKDSLARARALLASGEAREALLPLDRALELAPRDAQALYLRGFACFETAPTDSQQGFFYADAMTNFEAAYRAGYGVQALFAASRAARRVPDPERALALARRGAALLTEQAEAGVERASLDVPLERTWAEASFDVYMARRSAQEDATEFFTETEDQLGRLLGRTPDDPWVYTQLANLYGWEGRSAEYLEMLERALALEPRDRVLHERVVRAIRTETGRAGVVERYERFQSDYPEVGLGYWFAGQERFYLALEAFEGGEDGCDAFQQVEADFRRCADLEPDFGLQCRNWQVVARNARGWCLLRSGDLQGAKEAFLSLEDLNERGLATTLRDFDAAGNPYDRLASGVDGLAWVTARYVDRTVAAGGRGDRDALMNAAAIADYLHAYDPDDATHANNAGFLNRDAAVALERSSRQPRFAAGTEADARRKRELEEEEDRLLDRAQELMQRSYAAYQRAAELTPEDVRVVNDTGLVMAYYLRDDVEAAESYFHQAIAAGVEQLARTKLTGQELADLREAYGDAHQNLGVIALTIKNDPVTAGEWFRKSMEIGPASRQFLVGDQLVPMCERLAAGGELTAEDREVLDGMVWLHNPK